MRFLACLAPSTVFKRKTYTSVGSSAFSPADPNLCHHLLSRWNPRCPRPCAFRQSQSSRRPSRFFSFYWPRFLLCRRFISTCFLPQRSANRGEHSRRIPKCHPISSDLCGANQSPTLPSPLAKSRSIPPVEPRGIPCSLQDCVSSRMS